MLERPIARRERDRQIDRTDHDGRLVEVGVGQRRDSVGGSDQTNAHGAALALNPKQVDLKVMKSSIRGLAREAGRGRVGWKIFEMSGNAAGQTTAWGLLDFGAYLAVVGYTADKVELRLSNLMAFDATARGNWGCAPANYPPALKLVLERKIVLDPYVEHHTLNELPELFEAANRHEVRRRAIVRP